MHAIRYSLLFGCLTAALAAAAQERKPGLYEVTLATTTVSPTPEVHPPRTWQACLTQEMIDAYGAIVPENLSNMCQLVNVARKPGGMTADLACSGYIKGKGTLEVNWSDSEHSKGNIHFSGTIHPGDNDIKIEWSAETTSVYKSPDCGVLKPPAPPAPPSATPPSRP
ncbi:MAG: DUF3617 family protein [Acidobacteriaceae bacterium]|jgi:hypothetical protein